MPHDTSNHVSDNLKEHAMLKEVLLITFSLCTSIMLGQKYNLPKNDLLYKVSTYCVNNGKLTEEKTFDYSDNKLIKESNYYNSVLTDYIEYKYNDLKNTQERDYYNSKHEFINTTLLIYDHNQILITKRRTNRRGEIDYIIKYDTLGRVMSENYYYDDYYEPENSCHYFSYEYEDTKLVTKSLYKDCSLKSHEENSYDNKGRKIKTVFYTDDILSKYIIYEYDGVLLSRELTYSKSSKFKIPLKKEYLYNNKEQLVETIVNGFRTKLNYYQRGKLIRSENYYPKSQRMKEHHVPQRNPSRCNTIVIYEYH